MTVPMRPILILNPADDEAFVTWAQAALGSVPAEPAAFEQEVRRSYPAAVVHVRDLAGDPTVIWYVYRDGRWVDRERRS
jgi:hypothetical protein